jgi:transcriptional regulator with XRE-family HTH domain
MNNQVMSFGENLKYHRKKQKLSQKKLASLIGVGQTTIKLRK